MSVQGYTPAPYFPEPVNGAGYHYESRARGASRAHYWIHALLLATTLFTTTAMGARMAQNFHFNLSAFELEREIAGFRQMWSEPSILLSGLPFSLSLMFILLSHEFGHYFACAYYRIDASLPYFLPAPTFIGTAGAFIRIRSPLFSRNILFDVGVAGPLVGFLALLPFLSIGLAFSKIIPGIAQQGDLVFGTPLVLRLMEALVFPGVSTSDIYLHPVARAAWVGLFATALNLLPIGQLDGGHILYAFVGGRHKTLSRIFTLALIPLGYFWWVWWVWAAFLFFLGRHPAVFDSGTMTPGRRKLGLIALLVFILSFTPAPANL